MWAKEHIFKIYRLKIFFKAGDCDWCHEVVKGSGWYIVPSEMLQRSRDGSRVLHQPGLAEPRMRRHRLDHGLHTEQLLLREGRQQARLLLCQGQQCRVFMGWVLHMPPFVLSCKRPRHLQLCTDALILSHSHTLHTCTRMHACTHTLTHTQLSSSSSFFSFFCFFLSSHD